MREIKFRAWQKYHKKMVEVTKISFDDNGEIDGVATFVENQAPQRISYRDDLLGRFFLTDERGMVLELMQYTGLKDKKGVEIYEGDIVLNLEHNQETKGVVVFVRGGFRVASNIKGFKFNLPFNSFEENEYSLQVLGNIYENPELLEREPQ